MTVPSTPRSTSAHPAVATADPSRPLHDATGRPVGRWTDSVKAPVTGWCIHCHQTIQANARPDEWFHSETGQRVCWSAEQLSLFAAAWEALES